MPRGGRIASAPRSAGQSSAAPRGSVLSGNSGAAYLANLKKSADAHRGPGVLASPFVTPLNAVLAASLVPARTVGDVIAHPGHLVSGGPSITGIGHHQSIKDVYAGKAPLPSQALRKRGLLPGGKLGAVAGFVADVALDPTTYLTFGGGAASHGAERIAADAVASAAARRIDEIARTRAPTISEIARANAERAAAEAAVPKTLKVGIAVPFTRGKEITLAETRAVHDLARTVGGKLPEGVHDVAGRIRGSFATDRNIDPRVRNVAVAVEHAAQRERNDMERTLRKLSQQIVKATKEAKKTAKSEGRPALSLEEARIAPSMHLDNPSAYPVPAGLGAVTEHAREIRDHLMPLEHQAGIDFAGRDDYMPHVGKTARDRRRIRLWNPPPRQAVNRLDKPFFINPRTTDNFDQFIAAGKRAGFEPELDVVKLLRTRWLASINARAHKAMLDAIAGQHAIKEPLAAVPSTAKQEARVAAAEQRFAEVMAPTPTEPLRQEAAAARQTASAARADLRAAMRTGDLAQVDAARQALGDAQAARFSLDGAGAPAGEATAAIERQIAKADRAVTRAQKRLEKAQAQPSKSAVRTARAQLSRAEATARQARLALERARGTYGGTNVQIAAATKGLVRSQSALTKSERAVAKVETANAALAAQPGRFASTPEEWAQVLSDHVKLEGGSKYHKGLMLPPEIADALDTVHKDIAKMFEEPDDLKKMGRFVRQVTSHWKSLALLSAGYHIRNVMDDSMRAYMAGARNPRSYVQAVRILRGSPTAKVRIGKQVWTHEQFLRLAKAHGVIDTGQVAADIHAGGELWSLEGWRSHVPGRGTLSRASQAVGDVREDATRLGTFLELMKRGDNPFHAADQVRRYLFDYGDVSRAVGALRQFWSPFITYTAKAIPFSLRELARRPGRFSTVAKTLVALNTASGNPDLGDLPMYLQSSFPVPLPNAVKGALGLNSADIPLVNPRGLFGLATLDMLDPRLKQAEQNWSSQLNPFIATGTSIALGENLFFRSRLPALSQAPGLLDFAAGHGLPIPTYVAAGQRYGVSKNGRALVKRDFYTHKPVSGYSSYLDAILRTIPVYGQVGGLTSNQARLSGARLLLGLPITSYDKDKARKRAGQYANR